MSSSRVSLQDICERIVDCPHKTAPESAEAFGYAVGTKAIRHGEINFSNARPVSKETYDEWTERLVPRYGDMILCREAPVGPVALVPPEPLVCLGQRTVLLRPDPSKVDPAFLSYLLASPEPLARMRAVAEGSTTPHLNVSDVRSLEVTIPSLEVQKEIVRVLGSLDSKIDHNRKQVLTLNAIAEIHWRHMTSSLGSGDLSEIAVPVRDSVQPRERPSEIFEQFSIPAFDAGRQPDVCLGEDMASGKTRLPNEGAMLVSKLNPSTWRAWLARPSGSGVPVCSPEFIALTAEGSSTFAWIVGAVLFDQAFRSDVLSHVSGTTGSRQRVRPADLLRCQVPLANTGQIAEWEALSTSVLGEIENLTREYRTLAGMRDALLPNLISGRTMVPSNSGNETDPVAAGT